MTWLADIDLQAVRDLTDWVAAANEALDRLDRPAAMLQALEQMLGADATTWDQIDGATGVVAHHAAPELQPPDAFVRFVRSAGDHPLLRATADAPGHALRLSDVIAPTSHDHAALRADVLTPAGGAYAIAVGLTDGAGDTLVAALQRRERDFSERDRDLLELAAPALGGALDQARARDRAAELAAGVASAGATLVLLDASGEIQQATPEAQRWLAEHFGCAEHPGWLPGPVARWLALPPRPPLVSVRGARRLTVRLLPGDPHVLLLEEAVGRLEPSALRRLGLNDRETEVLCAAAYGCGAEPDDVPDEGHIEQEDWIAAALFLSVHAVRERLERVEVKLAVGNRAAAVTRALRESL